MKLLSTESILIIHEKVINKNELQGLARNKSLDALVNRIGYRVRYEMTGDIYNLAATHAFVNAVGRYITGRTDWLVILAGKPFGGLNKMRCNLFNLP